MGAVALNLSPAKTRARESKELIDQEIQVNSFFGTTSENTTAVWFFDGDTAARYGIEHHNDSTQVTIAQETSLKAALSQLPMFLHKDFVIHNLALLPGQYYPRISRPNLPSASLRENYSEAVSSLYQLRILTAALDNIFATVHPSTDNMKTYGSEIRNLIILAATECEAQWKGVLKANGCEPQKWHFCTKDYVKLLKPMRLDEYKIKLCHFPLLGIARPFEGWIETSSTESLGWYHAYNSVKHDRENSFNKATLADAVKAVCALVALLVAQYGKAVLSEVTDLDRYFQLEYVPLWNFSELYCSVSENDSQRPTPVKYSF
jgi:hypothetical protein